MTKNGDWQSIIRQKINNLYTRYFDKNVILSEQYMNLLKTPKNCIMIIYMEWIWILQN